jgi:hypothetical protein
MKVNHRRENMSIEVKVEARWRADRGRTKSGTVYFSHADENMLENFGNRVARPTDLYKTFLPKVRQELGIPESTRFVWSQRAGCRCGCSPGFVCKELRGQDVWVTLTGAPKTSGDPDAEALAEMRKEGLARQLSNEQRASELLSANNVDAEYVEQLEALISRD